MPRVTVIIPTYNHRDYVGKAISSVLDQSFDDFEIIIHDDCSTDGTAEVIRGFSDPRIRVKYFPENMGASWVVNCAITQATGDYIAILNSDDCFLPGKLERQVEFLDRNPDVAAVFGMVKFIDECGSILPDNNNPFQGSFTKENLSRHAWLNRFFMVGNALCHPTVLIRRECYERLGGYDVRLAQIPDLDMWIRVCSKHEIHVLPEELTAYRVLQGEANASATSRPEVKVRHDWEMFYVWQRYLDLPAAELQKVFAREFEALDLNGMESPRTLLARLSIKKGSEAWSASSYLAFGLHIIHENIGRGDYSIKPAEYMSLTGSVDPFNLFQDDIRTKLQQALHKVDMMQTSTSWRLTAPLRAFARTARQV